MGSQAQKQLAHDRPAATSGVDDRQGVLCAAGWFCRHAKMTTIDGVMMLTISLGGNTNWGGSPRIIETTT